MARTDPYSPTTPNTIVCADGVTRLVAEHMTLAEFEAFPWPEGQRWELIWGTPIMSPAPKRHHQLMVGELYAYLKTCLGADLLPTIGIDVRLPGSENYVCPDITVVRKANVTSKDETTHTAVPALVIEVLSMSTAGVDYGPKLVAFSEAKVPEYWIVDPATCAITLHCELGKDGYRIAPPDAEGFVKSPLLKLSFKLTATKDSYTILSKK